MPNYRWYMDKKYLNNGGRITESKMQALKRLFPHIKKEKPMIAEVTKELEDLEKFYISEIQDTGYRLKNVTESMMIYMPRLVEMTQKKEELERKLRSLRQKMGKKETERCEDCGCDNEEDDNEGDDENG